MFYLVTFKPLYNLAVGKCCVASTDNSMIFFHGPWLLNGSASRLQLRYRQAQLLIIGFPRTASNGGDVFLRKIAGHNLQGNPANFPVFPQQVSNRARIKKSPAFMWLSPLEIQIFRDALKGSRRGISQGKTFYKIVGKKCLYYVWTCHCSTHTSVRLLLFGLQQRSPFGPPCGYIGQITKSSKCCCQSTYWIP